MLSTEVFVIGGGPAGLAAAIAARRRGFDVTVADPAPPPIDKACGEGIMPDGLEAASSIGLDLSIPPSHAFHGIRFRDGATSVEAEFPNGFGLGMRRTVLHQFLADSAAKAGVRLMWGARATAIGDHGVAIAGETVRARWIVGADGGHSRVRQWAGLEATRRDSRRFGFRRHYRVVPWSQMMEVHWGRACQLYVTPVGAGEVCVALISRDRALRMDDALPQFPAVAARLASAGQADLERGGVTASRRLRAVWRGNVALIGDASGSVDAVTGEGICLLFQQAVALSNALDANDLSHYGRAHTRLMRRPEFMADLLLMLDDRRRLRHCAFGALSWNPWIFRRLLAAHVGEF